MVHAVVSSLTYEGMCFPRASLAVGQDTGVEPLEHGVEGRNEPLENVLLGRLGPEYSIVRALYRLVWLFGVPNKHTCSPFVGLDHLPTFILVTVVVVVVEHGNTISALYSSRDHGNLLLTPPYRY